MVQNNELNYKLIFISGGVRSGKSDFAEQTAIRYAKQHRAELNYIATSKVEDEEMQQRIFRHRQQRMTSGQQWKTFEITDYFPENIRALSIRGVVLLDCLTVLLANELFRTVVTEEELLKRSDIVIRDLMEGLRILMKKAELLIVVSNEIHHELIDDTYVKVYQRTLGHLHQKIVQMSTKAYLVEATIPQLMNESIYG